MKKLLLTILILFSMVSAENWTGNRDTCFVRDTLDSGTVYFTDYFRDIGDRETYWLVVAVDDTAEAGYASDSVNFLFGYQLGTFTTDSTDSNANSTLDTTWQKIEYLLDTFAVEKYGYPNVRGLHSIGDVISYDSTARSIDTSEVAGYATMIVEFSPRAAFLMRFWVEGNGDSEGQAEGYALKIRFDLQGTSFNNVRRK